MLLFMKNPLNKLQKIPEISPIAAVVQVPWIVKTDDDMVNNILKMGALVKAVEHQRLVQERQILYCPLLLSTLFLFICRSLKRTVHNVFKTSLQIGLSQWIVNIHRYAFVMALFICRLLYLFKCVCVQVISWQYWLSIKGWFIAKFGWVSGQLIYRYRLKWHSM